MGIAEDTRWLDLTDQAALVARGEVTATELVEAAIERIEAADGELNAVIHRRFDAARKEASSVSGAPFAGVPFLVKDLWAAAEGDPICNGNIALKEAGYIAPADTTLVARYRRAGLVTVGRTNTPELGLIPTTEPLAFGPTRNPWDTSRTAGGSSGGSAAAVAAGLVPAAHASDGGGSIRIPAAFCGLVGLKVSQGRITAGPSRDENGLGVEHVVTRTVRDSAALLDATHGPGVGDTVMAPAPMRPYVEEVGAPPGRLRIGVLDHSPRGELEPECRDAVQAAAGLLAELGHDVDVAHPAALTEDHDFGKHFAAIWTTNAQVNVRRLGDMVGRPLGEDDVEPLTWALADRAGAFSAADLALAQAALTRFRRAVQQWWADGWDLLVSPTTAVVAPAVGLMAQDPEHPFAPFALSATWVPFTPAFNSTGQPAISLPLHWTAEGLPVGVQLVAGYGREDVLLRVAAQLEQACPWADRRPS
jgi:amidase